MKKRSGYTLDDAAKLIRSFADGSCGQYDWDEFLSYPAKDPIILQLQEECERVSIDFPPRHKHEWCNPDGREQLLRIAERIKKEAQQTQGGHSKHHS
jgi:hypothetical protein